MSDAPATAPLGTAPCPSSYRPEVCGPKSSPGAPRRTSRDGVALSHGFALALADAHTNFMRVGENLVPVCFGHNYQDHTGALGGLRPEKGVHDDGR